MNKYINSIQDTHAIKCATAQEKKTVGAILQANGEQISSSFGENINMKYPFIVKTFGSWDGSLDGFSGNIALKQLSFADFVAGVYNCGLKKEVSVKLNDDYTAKYIQDSDVVKVGCQDIPLAVIRNLVNAIDAIND